MSYSIEHNILDPNLYVKHQGLPHELYDLWREQDPVHWNPPTSDYEAPGSDSSMSKGFYVLTRYQDVFDASRNPELYTPHDEGNLIWDYEGAGLERVKANFMCMLPKDHAEVKQVITPPFSPKPMMEMAPKIDEIAREIVDEVAGKGSCEFVFDVAAKLPVFTFCELMGIPNEQRERVVELGNALADVEAQKQLDFNPGVELTTLALELGEEKRKNPDGLLFSTIVNDAKLNLDPLQIAMFFQVFAVAGHETTRSTASHFIHLMNQNPDQYALLREDFDGRIDNAIEEVLRYTSTTTHFRRTTTADTEIGGVKVEKGAKIYMSYGSANRDPEVFENPHTLDILRKNARKHLAFGTGPHVCTGARLARLQLKALLRQVVTRIPDITVKEATWLPSIWFNAIIHMPVEFTQEQN